MAELHPDEPERRVATSTGPHTDPTRRGDDVAAPASEGTLPEEERHELRERWDALQGRFVDDPSGSTRLADDLLRDTRERIQRRWEERHGELAERWKGREDLTTEDLRTTLRRYRDIFERLLSS